MTEPRDIPRLPVLDWHTFGRRGSAPPPSILDSPSRVMTASGRAAIALGLEQLGIGAGDEILVPTYHCPTMVAPIVKLGATPRYYPINERGEPILDYLAGAIDSHTRAIIVPHFFGLPQPMGKFREFCERRGLALIEDCAHAFFGQADGRPVGQWGDFAIASLTKFFPVPSGGILVAAAAGEVGARLAAPGPVRQVKALVDILETAGDYRRLRGLAPLLRLAFRAKNSVRRPPSQEAPTTSAGAGVPGPLTYSFDMDLAHQEPEAISKAIPLVADPRRIAERRRANYRQLAAALSGHSGFAPLRPDLPEHAVPYVFPLRVSDPDAKYARLRQLGLPVFRWNWLWPDTPALPGDVGLQWSSEVFQLACHQDLREDELACIATTVRSVCGTP